MRLLGLLAARAPRRALVAIALLGVAASFVAARTPQSLSFGINDFVAQSAEAKRLAPVLKRTLELPGFPPELSVIYPTAPRARKAAEAEIVKVARMLPQLERSRDGKSMLASGFVRPGLPPGRTARDLDRRLERYPEAIVGGPAIFRQEASENIKRDLLRAELLVLPLLLLLTLWVFRGIVPALLPVLIGWLTMAVALACLGPINSLHPISLFALNLVTGAALGLSLDYSLLLISRFREQLALGMGPIEAAETTVTTAGRTVMFSSVTVAAAFATLFIFPVPVLQSAAIGGVMAALLAGATAMVILPAMFSLLGARLNPRRRPRAGGDAPERGAWYRIARYVMRRPISTALASVAVLTVLAAPVLGIKLAGLSVTDLPLHQRGDEFVQRLNTDFRFASTNPIEVVAHGSRRQVEENLIEPIEKMPGLRYGLDAQLSPRIWYLRIGPRGGTFSEQTIDTVEAIQDLPYKRFAVAGPTADYLATAAMLREKVPLALALLCGVTLLLLLSVTRSLILPPKTLVMNAVSLAAAFGITVAIFQEGWLGGAVGLSAHGPLPLIVPIMVGVSVFGILTDYGIFLLTRIKEEWDAGRSNREAVAVGLERTGRIVTAAALLFCVAVGALMSSHAVALREASFGVAVAVAIDASIVRVGLVPSLMILLGRWNWWLPGWMRSSGRGRPARRERLRRL